MALPVVLVVSVAVLFRMLLMWVSPQLPEILARRVEVTTPENSWKQVIEGRFLHIHGLSPYDSDVYHQNPFSLWFFRVFIDNFPNFEIWLFLAIDIATALVLHRFATIYTRQRQAREATRKIADGTAALLYTDKSVHGTPLLISVLFLFNPFTIASCIAQTSTTINNFFIALLLLNLVRGNALLAQLVLAVAINQSLYNAVLIVPLILILDNESMVKARVLTIVGCALLRVCTVACILVGLVYCQFLLMGDWSFLRGVYGFILTVPDLTPTMGLFWYFFTEMFDHFRDFFTWVFQLNVLVYLFPLSLKLRKEPVVIFHILLLLITVFKSYPSVGDAALHMSLLPLWSKLFIFMRHGFMSSCILVSTVALAPVMWHLWIYAGSANANFYFAISLLYCMAYIFIMTDLLYAQLRRDVHLEHGLKPRGKADLESEEEDLELVLDW